MFVFVCPVWIYRVVSFATKKNAVALVAGLEYAPGSKTRRLFGSQDNLLFINGLPT